MEGMIILLGMFVVILLFDLAAVLWGEDSTDAGTQRAGER